MTLGQLLSWIAGLKTVQAPQAPAPQTQGGLTGQQMAAAGGIPLPTLASILGQTPSGMGLQSTPLAGQSIGMAPMGPPGLTQAQRIALFNQTNLPLGAGPTAGAPPLWRPNPQAMSNPLTVAQFMQGGRFPGMGGGLAGQPQNPFAQFALNQPPTQVASAAPQGLPPGLLGNLY